MGRSAAERSAPKDDHFEAGCRRREPRVKLRVDDGQTVAAVAPVLQTDDSWQNGYFDGSKAGEREYFLGAKAP